MPNGRPSTLRPWQRPLVGALFGAYVLLGATGLFLLVRDDASPIATAALSAHLVLGVLATVGLLGFALPHALAHGTRARAAVTRGAALFVMIAVVVLTGLVPLVSSPDAPLRSPIAWTLHVLGGAAIVLLYALHRRKGSRELAAARLAGAVGATLVVGALLIAADHVISPRAEIQGRSDTDASPFAPSRATTSSGGVLADSTPIADVAACGRCHARITKEWRRSAHRHASFTNPFYGGAIEAMRERYTPTQIQWCAGCHDPALLFTGKIASGEFDADTDPDARAGLTCLTCHAADVHDTLGNGGYIQLLHRSYEWERSGHPFLRKAHDILLQAKPDGHVTGLRRPGIDSGAFCSACHKAEIERTLNDWRWLRAQDTYDSWDDSGAPRHNIRSFHHPLEARSCRDCHMPLVADPKDPSADGNGLVFSHLFAVANTALPFLRGDEAMIAAQRAMLRTACRLDVMAVSLDPEGNASRRRQFVPAARARPAVRTGETIEVHVVIRNRGVGHSFPTGTIDSNEIWVRFEAAVGSAAPFWVSGAIDPETGRVDPGAEQYRSYVADRHGRRMAHRVGSDIRTRVTARVLGPGASEVVRYRLRVPATATGTLRLRATLRYRKFMRPFIDFLFPDDKVIEYRLDDGRVRTVDLTQLPIVDMAGGELTLPVTVTGTRGPAPPASEVADSGDLIPLNDLGVAYLLQGDPDAAREVFQEVVRVDPGYVDGWINLARTHVARALWDEASAALDEARRLAPGSVKPRFFEGEVHRLRADYPAAEAAFRDVLVRWPRERMALRHLAQALYEQDRWEEALAVLDRLFAIDEADARGWFWAARALRLLGREEEARAAEHRFERYRDDDEEPLRAGRIRLREPNLERLHQPIHLHVQPGLPGSG